MVYNQACRGYGYPWMDIEILVISMDIVDIHLKVELSGLYCNYSTPFNLPPPQIYSWKFNTSMLPTFLSILLMVARWSRLLFDVEITSYLLRLYFN